MAPTTPTTMDKFRARALPILTKTAHLSTPFITTFLLIHLSAPALANVGGSSLSSQTMLLGREYYQTSLEQLLVLTPLTVHAVAAILKRVLSPAGRPPRKLTHLMTISGYAIFLLFLPIHVYTHRDYPQLDTAPIYGVGPSELDYEFVKTGLQTWPIRSALLYGSLVLLTTVHMVDGMTLMWNSWLKESVSRSRMAAWKPEGRPRRMLIALGCIALPVLAGLYTLYKEPLQTFGDMAKRYQAVFLTSWAYQI